jgi:hypothetical protein
MNGVGYAVAAYIGTALLLGGYTFLLLRRERELLRGRRGRG